MKTINLYAYGNDAKLLEEFGATYSHEKSCYIVEDNYLNRFKFSKWIRFEETYLFKAEKIQNVSLKIGKNIAKSLCEDLYAAKQRIYIASPDILKSTEMLNILSKISKDKKIDIRVISTTSNIEDLKHNDESLRDLVKYNIVDDIDKVYDKNESIKNYNSEILLREKEFENKKNIKTIEIAEHKNLIEEKNEEIDKIKKSSRKYYIIFFLLLLISILIGIYAYLKKDYNISILFMSMLVISLFSTTFIYNSNKKIKKLESEKELLDIDLLSKKDEMQKLEDDYKNLLEKLNNNLMAIEKRDTRKVDYYSDFEAKFFEYENNRDKSVYPNMNIYIIDDKAYLGSMNFNTFGFFQNLESLIKIEDRHFTDSLATYFINYENNFGFKYYATQDLAEILYNSEEILNSSQE